MFLTKIQAPSESEEVEGHVRCGASEDGLGPQESAKHR